MKKVLKAFGIITLAVIIGFLMTACPTEDDETGWSGKTSTGTDLIVMDTDMLDSNLDSILPNGTLVFNNLVEEYMPVEGDIICAGPSTPAPYGFLYKVKSVNTANNGKIMITTEMATLEEAVENGETKESFKLKFDEVEEKEINGVKIVKRAGQPTTVSFDINKTIKGVTLTGSLELSAKADCDVKIRRYTMQRFDFSIEPEFKANLSASIGGKVEKEIEFTLFEHEFIPIAFTVGPVPVVIIPEISLECVITTEGEVKLSAVNLVSWDYSYVFGVRYTKGSNLNAFQKNTSKPAKYLEGVQLDLNGEVKIEPQLSLMFGLYSCSKIKKLIYAGVGMTGSFYASLAGKSGIYVGANANADAELSLMCGLEYGADAKLYILGYEIGELYGPFYSDNWTIWKKNWSTDSAFPAAPAGFTATAISSTDIYLSWSAVSGAAGYRVYTSQSSSSGYQLLGTTSTISQTWSKAQPNTTYYFKIAAYNSKGTEGTMSNVVSARTLSPGNYSLDGTWEAPNYYKVRISGSSATLLQIPGFPIWQDALSKGYISIGGQIWRNLTSTGNLTWSGQTLGINWNGNRDVATGTTWQNTTFTMSANGKELTVVGGQTFTRQ